MDPEEKQTSLTVLNEASSLSQVRDFIREACDELGMEKLKTEEVVAAIGEACSNAVRHGRRSEADDRFTVTCFWRPQTPVEFRVADQGQGFDPAEVAVKPVNIDGGGFGILLMTKLMDGVEFDTGPRGTVVRLRKKLTD